MFDYLAPVNRPRIPREVGVWFTNRFKVGQGDSAVFENVCRVNHSCWPNAMWAWNEGLGHMEITALRDLDQGEEVLISYISFGEEIDVFRRRERMAKWHFLCYCQRCEVEAGIYY